MATTPSTDPQPTPISAGDWRVVSARSELGFLTRTMLGLVKVRGRYSGFDGELHVDGAGAARGELRVQTETITTGIKRRDSHLRSKDFFHVDVHPQMRFELERLEPHGDGTAQLTGTLQIRDQSQRIDIPLSVSSTGPGEIHLNGDFEVDHRSAGFEFRFLPRRVRVHAALVLERGR